MNTPNQRAGYLLSQQQLLEMEWAQWGANEHWPTMPTIPTRHTNWDSLSVGSLQMDNGQTAIREDHQSWVRPRLGSESEGQCTLSVGH